MEYWQIEKEKAEKAREKEEWRKKHIFGYEDKGRTIFYEGEYGVLCLSSELDPTDTEDECIVMRWDSPDELDGERYDGGNWMPEFIDKPYEFKHINQDGTLKNK